MEEIILVKPTKEYEKQMIEYKEEHISNGENVIHACSRWDKMNNYNEWLNSLEEHSSFETIKDNWTVHTNFLGVRKSDNKVVGMIDIRHELTNDFLINYAGHIGYGVRPTERQKGYVTQMLAQALKFCRDNLKLERIMIACDKENAGSRKTIINAGGKLEREYISENGENVQIYWINLSMKKERELNYIIRKAIKGDSYNIAQLIVAGWQTAYKGLIEDKFLNNLSPETMIPNWERNILSQDENTNIYVCEEDNKIIGVIRFGKPNDSLESYNAEIHALYVEPSLKGNGIGTTLFEFAKKYFTKKDTRKMIIWCLKNNIPSIKFYEKMGGAIVLNRKATVHNIEVEEVGLSYEL